MPAEHNDPVMDQVLRRAFAEMPAAGPCPDAEVLAAWADHTLSAAHGAQLEAHVGTCARCQAVTAALLRTEPALSPPAGEVHSLWRQWRLAWLVPGMAAAALAVWVALRPEPASEVARPVATLAEAPPTEAPLTTAPLAPPQPAPSPVASSSERAAAPATSKAAVGNVQLPAAQAAPPALSAEAPSPLFAQRVADQSQAAEAGAADARVAAEPGAQFEVRSPDGRGWWRRRGVSVEYSRDAGRTWQAAVVPDGLDPRTGSASDAVTCWLLGAGGRAARAADGVTFRPVVLPAGVTPASVQAGSGGAATIVATDGRTIVTRDGGVSWQITPR